MSTLSLFLVLCLLIILHLQDTGKYCFGVEDTLRALELGSVETLICWENLDIQRYVLKNHANSISTTVLHLTPEQEKDKSHFTDKEVRLPTLLIHLVCIFKIPNTIKI